jgi:hypothetical protein
MTGTSVDNLVDEWGWKFVFGTSLIEVMKVGVDPNGSLFFVDRDGV